MKNKESKKTNVRGLKRVCSRVLKSTGLKANGTLKKGFKYLKGGKIVKVTAKTTVKKKAPKKKSAKKTIKKKVAKKKKSVKK
ncbi:hypothetical protein [Flavobacterium aestivum]|uniref:hypothetical protein n=1 Tax=Flavobacterium aestivum TaxID=3003257 RepID=UPI0022863517|nr:hypothetical protein [Flavobacterium aestivum]